MKNPYFELHKEFKAAGAKVLMSSGQACVAYGIAAFSKDGDWIVEETNRSCNLILEVLNSKNAAYRLGAPLDIRWLSKGLTSHFEYILADGYRMRVDFCSRAPRVENHDSLWENSCEMGDIDIVDVESLIALKQTKRVRDYHIIGALAEVLGYNQDQPKIALEYLQDYDLLKKAVDKWPEEASKCSRESVQLIREAKPRSEAIISLALEQDSMIQKDAQRIAKIIDGSEPFQKSFYIIKKQWITNKSKLLSQHADLIALAEQVGLGR